MKSSDQHLNVLEVLVRDLVSLAKFSVGRL